MGVKDFLRVIGSYRSCKSYWELQELLGVIESYWEFLGVKGFLRAIKSYWEFLAFFQRYCKAGIQSDNECHKSISLLNSR